MKGRLRALKITKVGHDSCESIPSYPVPGERSTPDLETQETYKTQPKAPKAGVSKRVVHPNSRTAAHLARKQSHVQRVEKHHTEKATKLTLLGEKLLWFLEVMDPEVAVYTKEDARELVETYLQRFEDELEQISIKHSIGTHRKDQHAVRKKNIELLMEQERAEYDGPGFEIPDLFTLKNMITFREWNQELRYIQNIKLFRLKSEKADPKKKKSETSTDTVTGQGDSVSMKNQEEDQTHST